MRWARHVAHTVERRGVYMFLVGRPEKKRLLGRTRLRWEIVLRWISKKWYVGAWSGSVWFGIGTDVRHL
jgi:hypothetical protein